MRAVSFFPTTAATAVYHPVAMMFWFFVVTSTREREKQLIVLGVTFVGYCIPSLELWQRKTLIWKLEIATSLCGVAFLSEPFKVHIQFLSLTHWQMNIQNVTYAKKLFYFARSIKNVFGYNGWVIGSTGLFISCMANALQNALPIWPYRWASEMALSNSINWETMQ